MLRETYLNKDQKYFSTIRLDLIEFVKQEKNLKVLEVGAGSGNTLRHLKELGIASEIHLIDIIDIVKNKEDFDSIRILDIEENKIDSSVKYDLIILADVIEHLKDPEIVIKNLKELLNLKGIFLVSIPNIRHLKAMIKIFFKGSFKYEEEGLFDRTHLRFFCKSDMIKLFDCHKDLSIIKIKQRNQVVKSKTTIPDKLTFGVFSQFLTTQYLFQIEKI